MWTMLRLAFERCFNPYFTGSNSGSYQQNLWPYQCYLVSILILLEVILEASMGDLSQKAQASFNPYFTGSNSGSASGVDGLRFN